MSGLIFVALFAAWAVYLVPRALEQHDEMARTRSVQSFSGRLRTFAHIGPKPDSSLMEAEPTPASESTLVEERPQVASRNQSPESRRLAARKAAARRRRVLAGLVALVVVTATVAGVGYLPLWTIAVPAGSVIGFLTIARLSVRAAQPRAVTAPVHTPAVVEEDEVPHETTEASPHSVEVAAETDGFWDPLPLTLPTYVTKPSARRTIRSIELTGITSSGHDAEDSRIARDAEASRISDAEPQRRVAGA